MGSIRYAADAVADLAALPNTMGQHPRLCKPGRVEGTRELVIPKFPHVICYDEQEGDCVIVRILHQATQWPRR